uniref:Uncharacterized protein n=1 Tax=Arundo donax TaxID=35708 RepID=A0A0A9HQC9_ARUDO
MLLQCPSFWNFAIFMGAPLLNTSFLFLEIWIVINLF